MRVRDVIRDLPASRIAEIWALGMGDPAVIPLWYGESDLPTPDFISAAATAALQAGHTFYTYKAGLPKLGAAIADDRDSRPAAPSGRWAKGFSGSASRATRGRSARPSPGCARSLIDRVPKRRAGGERKKGAANPFSTETKAKQPAKNGRKPQSFAGGRPRPSGHLSIDGVPRRPPANHRALRVSRDGHLDRLCRRSVYPLPRGLRGRWRPPPRHDLG